MFGGFSSSKCKTQCKLCVGRIKLMRNKRLLQLKQMRKEVADLLRANKQENARIRVETVIRENLTLQAYEVLELFVELLAVRVHLIEKSKERPQDMNEALGTLVYAAARIQDFPELLAIRAQLAAKYGKEFITEASSDISCLKWNVNENMIRCLTVQPPSPEDKLATLSDIAQEYAVEWDAHAAAQEMLPPPSAQPRYPGGPVGMMQPPVVPQWAPAPMMYADAAAAAAAAHLSASQAMAAAEAAQRFAESLQNRAPDAAPTAAAKPTLQDGAAPAPLPDALPHGFGLGEGFRQGQPPSVDDTSLYTDPGAEDSAGGKAAAPGQRFTKRSDSAIQRSYDAAAGPPTKADAQQVGKPSAPPAPPAPVPAAAPAPRPPAAGGSSAGGDDFSDLAKRFEALKRGGK
ncbi:hypothetical protein WJX81_008095 [Elliptochloris bilobata]|uniref:IST1-like protein n=1 Tax=Elliptochloris bilobata TaxID=381761 RepID=A0AAW1RAL7_9CHLO